MQEHTQLLKATVDYKIKTEIVTRKLAPWEEMVGRKEESEEDDNKEDDKDKYDSSIWFNLFQRR